MRLPVLILGIILCCAGFGRLAAQTFTLDQTKKSSAKKTTASPGGIVVGPFSRKIEVTEEDQDGGDDDKGFELPKSYSSGTPTYIPSFGGGGMFQPKMTLDDIKRQKAERAWRDNQELEMRHAKLMFQQRVREEVDAVLRDLRKDLFGEGEDAPANLRKETPEEKSRNAAKTNSSEQRRTEGTPPLAEGHPKTDDEIFEADIRKKQEEISQVENPEERERLENALKQRAEARQRFLRNRSLAEEGANFFFISPNLRISEQYLKAGLCNLFDGQTFFGWRTQKEGPYGGGKFVIANQMICSDPEHPGLLYTTNQFGDATFQLDYQAEEGSEVFLLVRTSPNPTDLNSSCYAIVLNSADFQRPRGTIIGRHALSVEQLQKQDRDAKAAMAADGIPPGKRWRKVKAQFDGAMLRVMIDKEEPVTLYEAKPPGCGYLGLLVTKGNARFQNLVWSPGSSISLFDGIDPTPDWRFQKEAVQWIATRDVTLRLTGGPGVVETKKTFDNFVLQLEYNMTFNSGRSGLFFRSTPREERTGYEISIQNFPTREDRAAMLGVDVGSFPGKKQGRYVRPEDQKWNYLTVVAVDRQFQTWVNGVPVCERSVPVKDALLSSGTLQILAPNPSTNVQFRNIRITPIPPRSEKPRTFEDRAQTTYEEMSEQRKAIEREKRLDEEMKEKKKNP